MKKIKNFSKVIGIIKRGDSYFPSNEKSEEKLKKVMEKIGLLKLPATVNVEGFRFLRDTAMAAGFQVIVHERGINR